ncbi:MAG: YitT family protein, partial [Bacilli bacterium]
KNEEIKKHILEDLGRGVTQIRVIGGYTNADKNKLVCVLSTFEFLKLKKIIYTYDKNAFFYAVRASEVSGEGFSYEK